MVNEQPRVRPGEWDGKSSQGFWDTNRSPNLGQTTSDHIYQPLRSGRMWHKVKFSFFLAEFNKFQFRVFLLLD